MGILSIRMFALKLAVVFKLRVCDMAPPHIRCSGIKYRAAIFGALFFAAAAARAVQPPQQPAYAHSGILDFNSRVWAQEKIERVYYSHRIWPAENPGPKPLFEDVVSNQDLQNAVQSYLTMSDKLPEELEVSQLQGELDRIAASTKSPQVLLELFTALNNDVYLITETLVRQTLVQHLFLAAEQAGTLRAGGSLAPPNNPSLPRPVYILPAIPSDSACAVWRPVRNSAPSIRVSHTAVFTGSEMIVWGGETSGGPNGPVNDGGRYNPVLDDWLPLPAANAPTRRRYHTAVWSGTEMIVWGGEVPDPGVDITNTGGRYNPTTNTWIATSTGTNTPHQREQHTAIWTGIEMIIWGGQCPYGGAFSNPSCDFANSGRFNTGGRYNPATDSWTPTSMGANVPLTRYNHTAVWTGDTGNSTTRNRMIVWSGFGGGSTGGIYDPSLSGDSSWVATSTDGAPSARSGHTATWAGNADVDGNPITCPSTCPNKMIIWGGGNFEQTGGLYDPGTDSWIATSMGTSVPAGRQLHTAVWTGAEMIVWGGKDSNSVFLNSGGRYNPAETDPDKAWVTTSTGSNAPAGRTLHTAVWDALNGQMIVWGGRNDTVPGVFLNTGGRYSPASNNWLPTSQALNVPKARSGHTAVWTGSEMVVWGGVPRVES